MKGGFTRKRCPKCGGNVYLDRDLRSWYEGCLQCGYTADLPDLVDVRRNVSKGTPEQARASGPQG